MASAEAIEAAERLEGEHGPIKVAIVGGGCAAMAAAFELSRPEHRGAYRITVVGIEGSKVR